MIENLKLKDTYFPGWTIRITVPINYPQDIISDLQNNYTTDVEVVYAPDDPVFDKYGMLWRFLVIDDPNVVRMISRDSDSRLNARERFAVEEWITSGKPCHTIGDHPWHKITFNGGMIGLSKSESSSSSGGYFSKNSNHTMHDLIYNFLKSDVCNSPENQNTQSIDNRIEHHYGCDNIFLRDILAPLFPDIDRFGHDAYYCERYPKSSRGFPTPRDKNSQHVGQIFDSGMNNPLTFATKKSPIACQRTNNMYTKR